MKRALALILIMMWTQAHAEIYNAKRGPDEYFKGLRYSDKSLNHYIKLWSGYFKLDRAVVKAVIEQESGWDHTIVSKKGARGLMQIMPSTAEEDLRMGPDESLFNPYTNIYYGCKYLSEQLELFEGDYFLALIAYYGGPSRAWGIKRGTLWGPLSVEVIRYAEEVFEKAEKYYPEGEIGVCSKEEREEGNSQIRQNISPNFCPRDGS